MHSIYSRILATGFANPSPWKSSTMAGVLAPSPIIVRFLDNISKVLAAIAMVAGVLEKMLMIAVPNLILRVTCDIAPREAKASRPHDSGIHNESILLFLSACFG